MCRGPSASPACGGPVGDGRGLKEDQFGAGGRGHGCAAAGHAEAVCGVGGGSEGAGGARLTDEAEQGSVGWWECRSCRAITYGIGWG